MPRRKKSENDKPAGRKPRISQAEFQRSAESKRRSYASRKTSSPALASSRARPNWEKPPSTMVVDDTTYQVLRHDLPAPKWSPNPCYLCSGHRVLSPYTFRLHCAENNAIEWGSKRGEQAVEFPEAIQALATRVLNEYGIAAPYPTGTPIKCPACKGKGYGPQGIALTTLADEIFYGGQKGGGKTAAMTMWMVSGNPHLPNTNPDGSPNYVNRGYYFHPAFRGLVLRKNQEDLKAWVKYAAPIYRQLGAEHMRRDNSFEFPSGATIWTGHLKDSDSYEKYMGIPELHRVAIEEVTQIPEEELYEQIRSCVRATTGHSELRPQLFLDANPEGPGMQWVASRFVHMKDEKGQKVPKKTIAKFYVEHPLTKKKVAKTRIFIPAGLRDNPHLGEDYLIMLAGLSERLRKAYLEGDWDNMTGAFFSTFRNPLTHQLPFQGEPEKACHVIVKRKEEPHYPRLEYWWARQMGGDWGFGHEAAYHWGCRDPNTGRLHVYREFGGGGISAMAQGVRIAELSRDELEQLPSHSITMWYSRDAFQRRSNDEGIVSFVELISRGIAHVLGPDAIYVPDLNTMETAAFDYDFNQRDRFHHEYQHFRESLLTQKKSGITIKMANSNRVLGWNYIRDGFEWADPIQPTGEFNPEVEHKIRREFGIAEAERYRQSFERRVIERPWLQIWDTCPRLLEAIPRAPADDRNPEDVRKQHWKGADWLESCFISGTLVETDSGERPIESIKAGDFVLTRVGLRRVLSAGLTARGREVIDIRLSNGRILTGTPEHRVFTTNRGWTTLESLRYTDALWQSPRASFSKEENTHVIQSPTAASIVSTTGLATSSAGRLARLSSIPSIALSGKQPMVKSRGATKFTMLMGILSTTLWRIWNACRLGRIGNLPGRNSASKILNGLRDSVSMQGVFGHWLRLGTSPRLAYAGTPSTIKSSPNFLVTCGNARGYESSSVSGVHQSSSPGQYKEQSSVPMPVNTMPEKHLESMTRTGSASAVGSDSGATSTSRIVAAPVYALLDCGRRIADVYNLEVEDQPEYFAEGVLVHNCRYLISGFRDDPQEIPIEVRKQQAIEAFKMARPGYSFDELVMFNRHLEEQQKKETAGAGYGTLGRRATMARRALQQAYGDAKLIH